MNDEQKKLVTRTRNLAQAMATPGERHFLYEVADKLEVLDTFVQDIADHGLRTDMHPTIVTDTADDAGISMYARLTSYFEKSETNLRLRAKVTLGVLDGE